MVGKAMTTIYVVMGTCGEYSDREEWPVCAYADEEQAKLHVDQASECVRLALVYISMDKPPNPEHLRYDAKMYVTFFDRTTYYYMTVPVAESVEAFVAQRETA